MTMFWSPDNSGIQIIQSAAPSPVVEGQQWYNDSTQVVNWYSGSAWMPVGPLDTWTTYTPTVGNWTLGNGTVSGRYCRMGRWIVNEITFTVGTTTSASSNLYFVLAAAPVGTAWLTIGTFTDASAGVICPVFGTTGTAAGGTITPFVMAGVNQINNGGITSTVPFAPANGDVLRISSIYEAAA